MSLMASDRGAAMPPSPIRKLAPYAVAAKQRGIKIFHLNIGQPDVPSPELFWDAVQNSGLKVLEYGPSDGLPELRNAMAAHYSALGFRVSADQVIVTTAGSEALSFAMMSALNPGDEVIVPEPMYANYIGFARGADVKVVPLPTRIEDNFALPSAEAFAEKIGPRTKAILICNPSNPTGTIYSEAQMMGLRDLCMKHGLFLISDEVYRDFNYSDHPVISVLQLEGMDEHAIMIDSVSKRFSLCGARVGFLVSRNKSVMGAAMKFAQARLSPPTLEQIGVLGAMQTPASYFADVRAEYMRRRDLVVSRVRAIPGAVCPDIEGAFYATVRLPVDNADRFAQWLLEEFSDAGRSVMLAPASGFYETPGSGLDEVRIAYVLNLDDLAAAMDLLEKALSVYPGRK